MKCEIIKDLLPSYIDDLTSAESNAEIEEHLKTCSKCKEVLEQMKVEVDVVNINYNKEKIKPFRKLNKRVLKAVLITLTVCVLIVGSYFYFFGIGWRVSSDDLDISYSYRNDTLLFEFELTNGRVLNAWNIRENNNTNSIFTFTECFSSVLDNRGEYPNQFSYGMSWHDEEGKSMIKTLSNEDCIILKFEDKTETLYLKEIVEELGV